MVYEMYTLFLLINLIAFNIASQISLYLPSLHLLHPGLAMLLGCHLPAVHVIYSIKLI
ncbi:hypothetical protein ACJX0J_034064, partial [Zea mays]